MSWRAEAEEIHRRRKLAEACGGPEAVAKHHGAGKLTVRERIAGILDPGSFQRWMHRISRRCGSLCRKRLPAA